MKKNILTIENIKQDFKQGENVLQVLRGISISFDQGKSYAVTGVSGSGKSTLMHILGGLDQPTSGKIEFNGENIDKLKRKDQFLNQLIGFVFQFHYLIRELTVLENIMLMGLIRGDRKADCKKRALDLLEATGMVHKVNNYPGQLSGGEQQRVSVIRALFNKPSFLLADEPTGNLDAKNAEQLINFLLKSQDEWGMGIIICSHDKAVYERMDTILTLHEGIIYVEKK